MMYNIHISPSYSYSKDFIVLAETENEASNKLLLNLRKILKSLKSLKKDKDNRTYNSYKELISILRKPNSKSKNHDGEFDVFSKKIQVIPIDSSIVQCSYIEVIDHTNINILGGQIVSPINLKVNGLI